MDMAASFLEECVAILTRTPAAFDTLLRGLPDVWILTTEGAATWSPYDVIGHLIHGERTDWMPRLVIILEHGEARPFDPFDREAHLRESEMRPLDEQLDLFHVLRCENLNRLGALNLGEAQLEMRGRHPALGSVTVRQLLATWVAHDLSHIVQISRTMAKRYHEEVGPWAEYLSVMR